MSGSRARVAPEGGFSAAGHMPQLDALRCFAVTAVVVAHLWRVPGRLELATLGVRLFFVLSGFLITGILLDCRDVAGRTSTSRLWSVRQFYVRRFLRIFPIYYLVIAVTLVTNLVPARDIWPWLVTYTTNVYITLSGTWAGRFGHFWSLAVEEQFYVVWPWLVLFAPRKSLVPLTLTGIAAAPVYRLYAYYRFSVDIGGGDFTAATLTPGSFDTLGAGALLALLWRSAMGQQTLQRRLTRVILPVGAALHLCLWILVYARIAPVLFFTFVDLSSAMVFAWLVSAAGLGFAGTARRVLESRPLVYVGRISYGIYVYHNFAPLLLAPLSERLGLGEMGSGFVSFAVASVLTLVVAMLSWRFVELPINGLKRHFAYSPSDVKRTPDPALVQAGIT